MNVYTHDGKIYCEQCGEAICKKIANKGFSTEYAGGPYAGGGGKSDRPLRCASHKNCLNAVDVDQHTVGVLLENELTAGGVEYVRQLMTRNHFVELAKIVREHNSGDCDKWNLTQKMADFCVRHSSGFDNKWFQWFLNASNPQDE